MEAANGQGFLTDIIAYVEVWSSSRTENYSKIFSQQLLEMGAKVSKTFNKQVTHVIFKDGLLSTWNRAKKAGVKVVSVLWVEKCREVGAHVDETLYPAKNVSEGLPHFIKKHKCMQPKDFMEKTPENDKKLQKRLEIMAKELKIQKASLETDTPVLMFEENGSLIYSPASKIKYQCGAMERRIKDMKEKRENLSPTASQMSQESDSTSVVAEHGQIPVFTAATYTLSSGENSDPLNTSFANVLENSANQSYGKEFAKFMPEALSTTDLSVATLWSSPTSTDDFKHTSPQQCSSKHLRILPNSMENDFFDKKTKPEVLLIQKHNSIQTGNSFSHDNSLDSRVSPEKTICLDAVENTSNNHLHSLTSICSNNLIPSPIMTNCSSTSKDQKTSRRRLSLRQSTSALCKIDSQNDFLQTMLTPVESTKDQDLSFEDYFSPSNFNKKKIRVSLPSCIQKLQTPNEMVYKSNFSEGNPDAVSSNIGSTPSRKRKRVSEICETMSNTDCMLSLSPQNKKNATPNYMSKEKGDTAKPLEYHLNPIIKEEIYTSLNRCFPTTGEGKFSTAEVKEHFCKPLHDQMNESNGKSKNTGKIKKPLRTLVMTSMSSENQSAVIQVVKKLGGFLLSDEVSKNTSHVVAGNPRRTLNVLMGIARGCWIVCYEWVLWSLEYGHWVSEEPYELSVDFPAAPISRFQHSLPNRKDYQKLFSDQPVMFLSPTSQPPYEKLCELVQLCGGKVSKTLRQAKICIGECKVGKHTDRQCLSEKWILDSITQHKICPLENYVYHSKI